MSFNKLFKTITDSGLQQFVESMESNRDSVPYLIRSILDLLCDKSLYYGAITDENKLAFVYLMRLYYNTCFSIYLDNINFSNILKYGKIEIYKVEAANGLRYATVKEVENGVEGLIAEYIYPGGKTEFQHLALLGWTFTGEHRAIRSFGYKLKYNNDSDVVTSDLEIILNNADALKAMMDWVADGDKMNKSIRCINKMKRNNGYKYATCEKDEIVENISIKQLLKIIEQMFPRNSKDKEYRKALAMVVKTHTANRRLTPLEISELRRIYKKFAMETKSAQPENSDKNNKIRKQCEEILAARDKGILDGSMFVFKIISTLESNNYSRCSIKQYSFIEDAYNKIANEAVEENNTQSEIISETDIDNSLASLSNAMGSGLFFEEE